MQITKVLKKHGYTLNEIAAKLGYAHASTLRANISNKGGKPANLYLSTLRNIADAAGCSVGEFFDDERLELSEWDGVQPKINIRSIMKTQGVSDAELSTRLNVTERQVKNILTSKSPNLTTLYKVANALNVPVTTLFSFD